MTVIAPLLEMVESHREAGTAQGVQIQPWLHVYIYIRIASDISKKQAHDHAHILSHQLNKQARSN